MSLQEELVLVPDGGLKQGERGTLEAARCLRVASTPSAVSQNYHDGVSCLLSYHRENLFDHGNDADENANVCDRGDRVNGFDDGLDRRCLESRFDTDFPREVLVLLADGVLPFCFSGGDR